MMNNTGALQIALGSPKANALLRRTNNFSINDTDVVSSLRTSHKCCAKQELTAAASDDLKTVTKRIETADTWDWVKLSESIAVPSRFRKSR
jgi:hypothetical protein